MKGQFLYAGHLRRVGLLGLLHPLKGLVPILSCEVMGRDLFFLGGAEGKVLLWLHAVLWCASVVGCPYFRSRILSTRIFLHTHCFPSTPNYPTLFLTALHRLWHPLPDHHDNPWQFAMPPCSTPPSRPPTTASLHPHATADDLLRQMRALSWHDGLQWLLRRGCLRRRQSRRFTGKCYLHNDFGGVWGLGS